MGVQRVVGLKEAEKRSSGTQAKGAAQDEEEEEEEEEEFTSAGERAPDLPTFTLADVANHDNKVCAGVYPKPTVLPRPSMCTTHDRCAHVRGCARAAHMDTHARAQARTRARTHTHTHEHTHRRTAFGLCTRLGSMTSPSLWPTTLAGVSPCPCSRSLFPIARHICVDGWVGVCGDVGLSVRACMWCACTRVCACVRACLC